MTYGIAHVLKTGVATAAILAHLATGPASAFCGFYVAQADSKLFNKSSKVVLARDGDQTAITMASDFEGDVKEFAVVVPVPTLSSASRSAWSIPKPSIIWTVIRRRGWWNTMTTIHAIRRSGWPRARCPRRQCPWLRRIWCDETMA